MVVFPRSDELNRVRHVVSFPASRASRPPRPEGLSQHKMLISMFSAGTPEYAFVKHLYARYGIVSVQHWDDMGGNLFDEFPLGEKAREAFMNKIGVPPHRQRPGQGSVVALFPRT
jgi:hypothetical protein